MQAASMAKDCRSLEQKEEDKGKGVYVNRKATVLAATASSLLGYVQ